MVEAFINESIETVRVFGKLSATKEWFQEIGGFMCMPIAGVGQFVPGHQRQIVWVSLMVLFAIGSHSCATGPNNLPAVSWQGDHIRFSTSVGRPPCGDSLVYMDSHVAELIVALDEPMLSDVKISYYWLPGRMDLSPCPADTDCADGTSVFSRTMFHDHEMVHVLLHKLGKSQTFLHEGMAEAFGRAGGSLTIPREQARAEVLRSLDARVDPATINYPLAGLFVRFLIETVGLAPIKRVYTRARNDTRIDDFRIIFEEECGIKLDEALDRFIEETKDCYPRINLCTSKPVSWDGDTWKHSFGIGCANSGVLEIVPGALRNEALIEIDQVGSYTVSVSTAQLPIEPVVILKCSCEATPTTIEAGSERALTLEPGRYRVMVGRMTSNFDQEPGLVQVTIQI